ncbi:MAG: hypothetical protein ACFHX7_15400 [Pseudomonadota bacterium]
MKRVYAIDIGKSEKCGGPVRVIVEASNHYIEDPQVIQKILKHLGLDEAAQARKPSSPEQLEVHAWLMKQKWR